jgi:hypothetical protein
MTLKKVGQHLISGFMPVILFFVISAIAWLAGEAARYHNEIMARKDALVLEARQPDDLSHEGTKSVWIAARQPHGTTGGR